jgi:hypothetical protein
VQFEKNLYVSLEQIAFVSRGRTEHHARSQQEEGGM